MFNFHSDDLFSSSDNYGRDSDSQMYSGFIPRVSYHDQVVLGEDAFGHKIYLDTGRF
tara:strand:+ start:371 stop:541 length:171 start_codon:yes stop_codon:yes gene_type:complete